MGTLQTVHRREGGRWVKASRDGGKERNVFCVLTNLELPLNPSFTLDPEGNLGLVVAGHDVHKPAGQVCVLRTGKGSDNREVN